MFIMTVKIIWYFLIGSIYVNGKDLHDCDNQIFCYGDILKTMQLSNPPIYGHSANFVEMKLKSAPDEVLAEFDSIKSSITKRSLLNLFAEDNFEPDIPDVCSNFKNQEMPDLEDRAPDKAYRDFVSSITAMWSKLIVRTSEHVENYPDYHTLVHLPNCFVKSDEFTATTNYYDNYWIVRGLLSNGLTEIAAGIIENYTYLIRKHSFVLHSNRVYSSRKTQLPLLAMMMENFYDVTKDKEFLLRNLEAMEAEFKWWKKHRYFTRVINKKMFKVFQYYYQTGNEPRPENYREDHQLASKIRGQNLVDYFYSAIRAMDETGFGFCSRFKREPRRTWASVNVLDLIPVELNSVLHRYAILLGQWFKDLKNDTRTGKKYENFARDIANIIDNVLWNKRRQMWFDWDLSKKRHQATFSPTNLMPLFTMSYLPEKTAEYSDYSLKYLQDEEIIDTDFKPLYWIVPSSTENTGRVLDYPYGSPPETLFIIEGLTATMQLKSEDLALELAKALVKTIYIAQTTKQTLYKQYSAVELGKGINERIGKRISKAGYAWSNAAVLAMFEWFGDLLDPRDYREFKPSLKHVGPVNQTIKQKRKGEAIKSDEDIGRTSNIAASSQQPSEQVLQREASRSSSSLFEISPANPTKKKNAKEKAMKSTDETEPEQTLKEIFLSEQRSKRMKKAEGSAGGSESPSNEAAKPKPHKKRSHGKGESESAESESPLKETAASEQPVRRAVVRQASKSFVEESKPLDETAPAAPNSAKKRSRTSSKLPDDEESEPSLEEISPPQQTKENKGKRPKTSE